MPVGTVFLCDLSEQVLKILLIGDSGVGKTSILHRLLGKAFDDDNPAVTLSVDAETKLMEVDGMNVKLKIWDTAGQERMGFLTSSYYRGAAGVLVMYDITQPDTFKNTPNWIGEIQRYAVGRDLPPVKMLVGTKCDLEPERKVSRQEGEGMVSTDGDYVSYMETSAKEMINVEEAFRVLVRHILAAKYVK